jgi:hypothetical protein
MFCPTCGVPMRDLPAPPSSTVYVCDNGACQMNDAINPSMSKETDRPHTP